MLSTANNPSPGAEKDAERKSFEVAIAAVGLAIVLIALGLGMLYAEPWLWGPYVDVLGASGPFFVADFGHLWVTFGLFLTFWVLAVKCGLRDLTAVVLALSVWAAGTLGYGFYLHHIVALQGLDRSVAQLTEERYSNPKYPMPANVRKVLEISNSLAKSGNAPWLPRAWTRVEWPKPAQ